MVTAVSMRKSFWLVPARQSGASPRRRAIAAYIARRTIAMEGLHVTSETLIAAITGAVDHSTPRRLPERTDAPAAPVAASPPDVHTAGGTVIRMPPSGSRRTVRGDGGR